MSANPSYLVAQAVLHGKLPKLSRVYTPCVDCGKRATAYDHRDYAKPLEVVPVCRSCNALRGPGANKHMQVEVGVKVPESAYKVLAQHSLETGRPMKYILSKAIERYCGGK